MRRRVGRLREDLEGAAVGLIVDALPALVLDDVALRVQLGEVERIEQETHAVGFHPERRLEVVRRHGLVIGGAIVRRGPVVRPANAFGELVVQAVRHMSRPGEHHVLEEVREAGPALRLVLRTDVVPHIYRHGRRRPIERRDDGQPVRQRVAFEGDVDRRRTLGRGGARREARSGKRDGGRENEAPDNRPSRRTSVYHQRSSFPHAKPSLYSAYSAAARSWTTAGAWRPHQLSFESARDDEHQIPIPVSIPDGDQREVPEVGVAAARGRRDRMFGPDRTAVRPSRRGPDSAADAGIRGGLQREGRRQGGHVLSRRSRLHAPERAYDPRPRGDPEVLRRPHRAGWHRPRDGHERRPRPRSPGVRGRRLLAAPQARQRHRPARPRQVPLHLEKRERRLDDRVHHVEQRPAGDGADGRISCWRLTQ